MLHSGSGGVGGGIHKSGHFSGFRIDNLKHTAFIANKTSLLFGIHLPEGPPLR